MNALTLNHAAAEPEISWLPGDALEPDPWKVLYGDLKRLASRYLSAERDGHTLQPTALVHEAWLRLEGPGVGAVDRRRFLRRAARCMRRILVDHARKRGTLQRGGGRARAGVDIADVGEELDLERILSVHEALRRVARLDRRLVRVVELRYFAGLSFEETATAMGVSAITAKRLWKLARAVLQEEMSP